MEITKIGTVAAQNIARALGLADEHVKTIEGAIKDEIDAMSSHFTLAVADMQTSNEIAVAELKSGYRYVSNNVARVIGTALLVFLAGVVAGLVL